MRLLLAFFLLCSFQLTALAQKKGAQLSQGMTQKMVTALHLDSAQKTKVAAANDAFVSGLMQAYAGTGDRRSKMEQVRKIKADHESAMKGILSKEQQQQYEQMKDETREKMSEAAAEKISERVTTQMEQQLNLTDQQSVQADSINRKNFQVILSSLMDDDEKGMSKLRAVRQAAEERNAAMKKILTDEQYRKYEQMQEEQREKMRDRLQNRRN